MQKIHKLLWSSQFIVEFVMYYSVGCGTTCDPQHHFCVFCDTLMKGIYLWMWKTAERSLFYATLCTLILKTPQFYFDQILLISNSIKQSQSHSQLLKQDETGYSRKVWTVFFSLNPRVTQCNCSVYFDTVLLCFPPTKHSN